MITLITKTEEKTLVLQMKLRTKE